MSKRKLVAALACRNAGSRLYGKPLQNLDIENKVTILDHLLLGIKATNEIDEAVIAISEGLENQIFVDYAKKYDLPYIIGDKSDVLYRLIQCGRVTQATDIFRVTTECPFIAWEMVEEVWANHRRNKNDITVTDYMPEGVNFEIYALDALELSHKKGDNYERSEYCSAYARNHPGEFKVEVVSPPEHLRRLDLRLTVDYPEDLVVCRKLYHALKNAAPHIPVRTIIEFLDENPFFHKLVEQYVDDKPIWANAINP